MILKQKNSKSGFSIRRRSSASSRRTLVVLGAPRGGTSLVAGALRLAEVFMGDDIDPANNEDLAFNFHDGNLLTLTNPGSRRAYLADIRKTIDTRNSSHAVWGWKDPMAALYIEDVMSNLVNPHFILVTRDITATAMRERIEASGSLRKKDEWGLYLEKANQALSLYQASVSLIGKMDVPALFVGYEKACRNAEDFADQLLDFVGGANLSTAKRKAAVDSIKLYAREGAISADLAHRPATVGLAENAASDFDLSHFSDLPAVYHRCAMLINLKHYEQGLSFAKGVLAQILLGFELYPRLKSNAIVLAEVEAGMWFMAAIAQINLGDGLESYQSLGRFEVIAKYFRLIRHKSDLINGMTEEATALMRGLERDLGK